MENSPIQDAPEAMSTGILRVNDSDGTKLSAQREQMSCFLAASSDVAAKAGTAEAQKGRGGGAVEAALQQAAESSQTYGSTVPEAGDRLRKSHIAVIAHHFAVVRIFMTAKVSVRGSPGAISGSALHAMRKRLKPGGAVTSKL